MKDLAKISTKVDSLEFDNFPEVLMDSTLAFCENRGYVSISANKTPTFSTALKTNIFPIF